MTTCSGTASTRAAPATPSPRRKRRASSRSRRANLAQKKRRPDCSGRRDRPATRDPRPATCEPRPANREPLDHMERPTSALHLTRVTLTVRALNAEPHTKEVGRDAVYYHHCVRSARGHDGCRGAVGGTTDAGTPFAGL